VRAELAFSGLAVGSQKCIPPVETDLLVHDARESILVLVDKESYEILRYS